FALTAAPFAPAAALRAARSLAVRSLTARYRKPSPHRNRTAPHRHRTVSPPLLRHDLDLVAIRILREGVLVVAGFGIAVVRRAAGHEGVPGVVEIVGAHRDVTPGITHLVGAVVVVVGEFDAHRLLGRVSWLDEVVREGIGLPAALGVLVVLELPRPEADLLVGVGDAHHRVVDAPLRPVVALDDLDLVAV